VVPFLVPTRWSLARWAMLLQAVIVVILVVGGLIAAYTGARATTLDKAGDVSLGVATAVAAAPVTREALRSADPSATLQPFAEQVRRDTGTDFVVVMSTSGIRYSHREPAEIGGRFRGHIDAAVAGGTLVETYTGTLGPSVRAVVPVRADGVVVGLVSVGIRLASVERGVRGQVPVLLIACGIALAMAWFGSWLIGRWLRRQTHGLDPAALRRMYEYYDAVLHSVREGLLLLDTRGRLHLFNDEAARLLGLPADAAGRAVRDLGVPPALADALAAGREMTDELHLTGDRIVVVSQAVARWEGIDLGTVVTLRDHTELRALTTELASIRGLAESLHAQAHEAANHLHTVISLIELGQTDEALRFATAELEVVQHLTDHVLASVAEPVLAALLLGKSAEAGERGIELALAADIVVPAGAADPRDLVTIVGNLLDNAFDAVATAPPPRRVHVSAWISDDRELVLRIADSGAGLPPDQIDNVFRRGFTTKPSGAVGRGLGLALVSQAVHRYGGRVEVSSGVGAVFTVRLPVPAAVLAVAGSAA
jgi:two-component system, CitB family, sensor kinase